MAGLSTSYAFDMSGHDLFSQLKDYYIEKGMTDQQLLNAGRAYGYVCAVYDCNREELNIPEGTKPTHLIAAVYKFLIDNPKSALQEGKYSRTGGHLQSLPPTTRGVIFEIDPLTPNLSMEKVGRQTGYEPATPGTTNQWKYRQLTYHLN